MAERAVNLVEPGSSRHFVSSRVGVLGAWVATALLFGALFPVVEGATSGKTARLLPLAFVAASAMLLLAVTRPDWLLVVGFFLLAFVKVEPAPVDLAFLLLIVVVAVRSHNDPLLLPPGVLFALLLFAPITILSLVNANDWGAALRFEAITLYLLAFAMFLPTMLQHFGVLRPAIKAWTHAPPSRLWSGCWRSSPVSRGAALSCTTHNARRPFSRIRTCSRPFLVPALIIVLEDLVRPRLLGWSTRRCGLVALILALGVLFSYSRAAILNFGLGAVTLFGVYLWRRRGRAAALKLGVAAALCGVAGFSVLAATNSLTFFESRSHLQSYDHNRFATQGAGFQQASVHLFGHGPGQVQVNLPLATHSVYARVAYEQGYIGLALIIAIFLGTLVTAVRFAKRDGDISGLGSGALLGAWVGLIANSFFIDTLHWRHLWIVAALIWYGATTQRRAAQVAAAERASLASG